MPQPLPILVYPVEGPDGTMTEVDDRELDSWRDLVIAHIKSWAGEILAATDWVTIKSFETGLPGDASILANRAPVRDTTNVAEAQLLAATTLLEIDAVAWSQALAALDTTQTSFSIPEA